MRKIEHQMLQAYHQRKNRKLGNTEVTEDGRIYLHGNLIAANNGDGTLSFSMCGWGTPTTRSRLNALGIRVFQRDWVQYALRRDGTKVEVGTGWFLADQDGYVID